MYARVFEAERKLERSRAAKYKAAHPEKHGIITCAVSNFVVMAT
jgi:hypothetical protein